jgi:cell division septal protein FtsQ
MNFMKWRMPDTIYSVRKMNRFISNLSMDHSVVIKKGTWTFKVYLDYEQYCTSYLTILKEYNDVN